MVWKFCEKAHFRIVSDESPETICGNGAFPQNFHTMKLGEITVFYAVIFKASIQIHWKLGVEILIDQFPS